MPDTVLLVHGAGMSELGTHIPVWQGVRGSQCQSCITHMGPTCVCESLWGLVSRRAIHQAVHCLSSHVPGADMASVVVALHLTGLKAERRGSETRRDMILLESRRVLVSWDLVVAESLERVTSWRSASIVPPWGRVYRCEREWEWVVRFW